MAGYIGPAPVPQATQNREAFTATSNQTSFATAGYTPSFIDVYLNGVKLAAADYTATNGSDVVLASGAASGDILEVVAFSAFTVADQAFTGTTTAANLTVTGAFTSQGIDDNANATAITIDSSENVGIGTISPAVPLHIDMGTDNNALYIQSSDQFANIGLIDGSGSGKIIMDGGELTFTTGGNATTSFTGSSERMRIDSIGRVGIGTSSPSDVLELTAGASNFGLLVNNATGNPSRITLTNSEGSGYIDQNNNLMRFNQSGSADMSIDSSGNVLVGKTGIGLSAAGIDLRSTGLLQAIRDGGTVVELNRQTSDGIIIDFRKDNTTVGSISSRGGVATNLILRTATGQGAGIGGANSGVLPCDEDGLQDDEINLGASGTRWKDLWLSGGVYLGGTGSANHLDDYEEGNFSPNIQDNSNTNASSYGIQVGVYRKIGGLVYFAIDLRNITATNLNGSDAMKVSGLPFTSASSGSLIRYPVSYAPGNSNGFGGETNLSAYVNAGTDDIYLLKYSSGLTSPASVTITELLGSSTNRDFWIAGTYPV